MDAPCKDCKYRVLGCHSQCIKYYIYQEKRKEIRKENLKRLEANCAKNWHKWKQRTKFTEWFRKNQRGDD